MHGPTGRRLRYGEVAAAAARLAPPKDVRLRDPADWKIAGKPVHRLDIPDKVLGKPVFAVDVNLPGMLHASIAQCPVFGGKVASVEAGAALAMRGVKKVVREESFVAVVADNWWRANEALKKVKIEWDAAGNGQADNRTIAAMLREGLAAAKLPQARKLGDTQAGLAAAAKVIEAEYQSPYLNHATMEPMTCTAWLKPEGFLEVWTSTQNGEASMAAAAETAGLPLEKVEVHKMMLGGGFGRRGGPQDFVRQGVAIAKAMPGVPVKLMWSREEDMQHGFYRPASIVRMKAGLDARGQADRDAHDDRLSVDHQGPDAGYASQGRHRLHGGAHLQRHALRHREPAGGLRDAQRSRAGRLLARAGPAERLLPRVLHRRAGGTRRARTRSNSAWRC